MHYESFYDDDGQLLNEFEMMWALREHFPLHFFVFKQVASHLAHDARGKRGASFLTCAGGLSDPHTDPLFLSALLMASVNKKAYCPAANAIRDKYYELFRGKGAGVGSSSSEREDDDVEAAVSRGRGRGRDIRRGLSSSGRSSR